MSKANSLPLTILTAGLAASIGVWALLDSANDRQAELQFEKSRSKSLREVEHDIREYTRVLRSLKGLFSASTRVDAMEFDTFAKVLIGQYPSIQAFEWIPRLDSGSLPGFEKSMVESGYTAYSVFEKGLSGSSVPVGEREHYYPVAYAYPRVGNRSAIGFDLGSANTGWQ